MYATFIQPKGTRCPLLNKTTPKLKQQMKKLILFFFVDLCSIAAACGQTAKLGVFVGPNFATIGSQYSVDETTEHAMGVQAGLFTEIGTGRWSIVPGLTYASVGSKVSLAYGAGNETVSLQCLQVPVNFVYNTGAHKFFFGGGLYIGFGLSGSINGTVTSAPFIQVNDPWSFNYKFTFNIRTNPDYGVNLLAGVHLDGGTIFTVGYGLGLKRSIDITYTTVRNDVISISIGYSIF